MTTVCYPVTRPIRVTEPTFVQEPIGLSEARRQVGLGDGVTYHDGDLTSDISIARDQVEHDTGVICYTGSFTWKLTDFPDKDFIEIFGVRPVTSITSITYVATDGDTDTFIATDYSLKTGSLVPMIALDYDATWPTTRGDQEGITITLVAGYASIPVIPAKVKQAVRLKQHELWQVRMGEDASKTVMAYERMVNLIRREDYA